MKNPPRPLADSMPVPLALLIALAFAASVGLTLVVLACALKPFGVWWPLFVLFFFVIAPIPMVIARRYVDEMAVSSVLIEVAMFLTTGIVISAFALPIIMARSPKDNPVIKWGACGLISAGNVVVFVTILSYFIVFNNEDIDYSMW
ncbi:PREDICTED: leptin receptor gene-related protein-like isoform X2 [Priapulus caudatus]|uniref:Leptin receptor gene-related protein-like isoform X2 n=1 Tax=Priapulus caudatus TaxID=37621 RepID=A0ABM1EGM9_PRICU|nr:PREDICTED: leptin receptor gene-related protein-like isoform X2 [Priapulus caudatus]